MANGKTPYNEDYNSPYRNNTLRWIVGNAVDYVGWVISHDIDQMKQEAQMQKDFDKAAVADAKAQWDESWRQIWEDAKAWYNFIVWEPEANVPWLKRMPTANVIHVDMPWTQTQWEATQWETQPTQTSWTTQTTQWTSQWTTWWTSWKWTPTNTQSVNPYDKIASDLLSQWLTSTEDVVYYLAANIPWWNSYSESERVSIVTDIMNRMKSQWTTNDKTQQWTPDTSYNNSVTQNMQSELTNVTDDTLYGKVWATEWTSNAWIVANQDANSAYAIDAQARIAKVREVLNENPYALASAIAWWTNPYDEQTMADVRAYAPDYWSQVQTYLKQIQVWNNANAIASGWEIQTIADTTNTNNLTVDYAVNNATSSVSSTQLLKSIDEKLAMNKDASASISIMDDITTEMEKQKNRLKNLQKEANTVFKWDASQAIVNAYINNKTQEIQNNLSILEWRYNSALTIYKTAVSHAEWAADHELKRQSLELDYYKELNWATTSDSTTTQNYTIAERNNNPLNMTVDFMKIMWAELWVDYEIWADSFVNSNWGRQYYAKLIWDPVETTIRILDRAVANGMNPFTKTSWSYIEAIWMNKDKWNSMSYEEKAKYINDVWLPREGWKMDNMAYYVNQKWWGTSYNPASANLYDKYLSWDYGEGWLEKTAKAEWQSMEEFAKSAKAYKADLDAWLFNPWGEEWSVLSQTAYDLLWLFAELYNLTADDSWQLDFNAWTFWLTYPYDKRDQIKNEMTLEKMVNARSNEIWFWQVTEWEWKMLRNASTALWSAFWTRDENINTEVNSLLSALWHATYWKNNDIDAEKWAKFRQWITSKTNWNSSLEDQMKDAASLGLNWWEWDSWVITNPADWNYVNAYWIID